MIVTEIRVNILNLFIAIILWSLSKTENKLQDLYGVHLILEKVHTENL